jgi:hypothetical protein
MTTTFSPSVATAAQSHSPAVVHRPATTSTKSPRLTQTAVTAAIVGIAVAAVAAALGFAAFTLGAQPAPAARVFVMPAHQPAVPGHETLPVLHLPTAQGPTSVLATP